MRSVASSRSVSIKLFLSISLILMGGSWGDWCLTAEVEGEQGLQEVANRIDVLLEKSWQEKKLTPAKIVDDAEYLRRTYLNLAGRIPSVSETREFLEDRSVDKRLTLVDRLLEGPGYVRHFANVWRQVYLPELMSTANPGLPPEQFDVWIRDHLRRNSSKDLIVRELLLGSSFNPEIQGGSQLFFQVKENKPENIAAGISRSVLGIRLECAQCHDHPFAKWKQEEFWSQAAFFSELVPSTNELGASADGLKRGLSEIRIPGKEKVVAARFLRGETPQLKMGKSPREMLVEWIVAAENPYFAKAIVNRLWKEMFGVGIVNPVDDLDDQNPPTHPEVLQLLANEFRDRKYDLKQLIRILARTRTYQLSSEWSDENDIRQDVFARMRIRPMSVDQLFDSLSQATGYYEPYVEQGVFAETPRRKIQELFQSESADGEARTSVLQALALMNGEFVVEAVNQTKSHTLSAIVEAPFLDVNGKVTALYLATLTRLPSEEELGESVKFVEEAQGDSEQKLRYGDLFWVLLNCSEFVLNH